MRCEEARPLLRRGQPDADAHVEQCASCFDWLEKADAVTSLLRAVRPEPIAPPARVAAGVMDRWVPARVSWRLGLAVAAWLIVCAGLLAIVSAIATPGNLTATLVTISGALEYLLSVIGTLLAIPRALLFDNPTLLTAYALLTVALCAAWARLYHRAQLQRRVIL